MKTAYVRVREVVDYEMEVKVRNNATEDEILTAAEERFLQSKNINKFCIGVEERDFWMKGSTIL